MLNKNWDILDRLRSKFSSSKIIDVGMSLLYLKYISIDKGYDLESSIKSINDFELKNYIVYSLGEKLDKEINAIYDVIPNNKEIIKKLILGLDNDISSNMPFSIRNYRTPKSIIDLSIKLLNIKNDGRVANFGSGNGTFILEVAKNLPNAKNYAIDINTSAVNILKIINNVLDLNINVIQDDILNMPVNNIDFAFSNYPLGMRAKMLNNYDDIVYEIEKDYVKPLKPSSADWLFNYTIVKSLSENGRAVVLTTQGATSNNSDRDIRQYFVDKGYVEKIITLPKNIFDYTAVSVNLMVLSKGNNDVRFIDASDIFEKGRRINTLTEENIDTILKLLVTDSQASKLITKNKIIEKDYTLNPENYLKEDVVIKNAVEFGSIINEIKRGSPVTAKELDEVASQEQTDYQYLKISNISDGVIDENLPYIKSIDEKYASFCLKPNQIILSKIGEPFKVAVADFKENKKILTSGNLYLLDLDLDRVNPYYIKAFLESKKGQELLYRASTGTHFKSINVSSLKKINIPLIALEDQEKIANQYLAKLDEINYFKNKLEKAINDLTEIID